MCVDKHRHPSPSFRWSWRLSLDFSILINVIIIFALTAFLSHQTRQLHSFDFGDHPVVPFVMWLPIHPSTFPPTHRALVFTIFRSFGLSTFSRSFKTKHHRNHFGNGSVLKSATLINLSLSLYLSAYADDGGHHHSHPLISPTAFYLGLIAHFRASSTMPTYTHSMNT